MRITVAITLGSQREALDGGTARLKIVRSCAWHFEGDIRGRNHDL